MARSGTGSWYRSGQSRSPRERPQPGRTKELRSDQDLAVGAERRHQELRMASWRDRRADLAVGGDAPLPDRPVGVGSDQDLAAWAESYPVRVAVARVHAS